MIKKQIKMQKGLKKMKNEYTFFSLLNEFEKIEIPRIQRSYAQGRESEKIVRDGFLGSIMKTLENKNEDRLCLDFIYGDSNNKKFIPIDGQQRLTTLYLLYWYLNNFEKNTVEKEKRKDALRKFTYETRESSKEFCERLSSTSIKVEDLKNTKDEKISSKIKNQTWYLIQWKDDPTIKAMLTMLDAIEEKLKFKDIQEIKTNAFEENGKRIYFYFIEVKTFGSADELYVKMNSRGKKLTTFENFKSKLEGYMDREILKKEEDKKTLNEFKKKIDNEWLNYFWEQIIKKAKEEENKRNIENEKKKNKRKENKKNQKNEVNNENEKNNNNLQIKNIAEQIDRCLMNLFMTIFENEMALIGNKTSDEIKNIIKDYDDFILKNEDERKLDFEKLKEQNVINETTIKYSCYVLEYYSMLQNAKQNTEQNTKQDTEHDTEQELDKIINYEEIINKMMNFSGGNKNDFRPEKIQFYIICKYLYKICEKEKDKDLVDIIKEADHQNKLTKILYFARNIVKNVYIDSEEKYCKMIKFMDNIVDAFIKNNYNSIFEYLKDLDVGDLIKQCNMEKEVKYLLYGEQKKANKICSNNEWKNEIIKMDANEYFTGNTRFLFEFVENRKKENLNANELEEYRKYVTLSNIIFSEKNNEDTKPIEDIKEANIDPICNDNDYYYLKRALFTIGNYMFEFSKRYSYLICSDKYQSWKKMLTGEKYGESKDVFRKLLDKIADNYNGNIEKKDIEKILKEIVETYKANKQPVYGVGNWREYIIRYPELIGVVKDNTNTSKLGFLKTVNNEKIDNTKDIIIIKNVNVSQTSWSFYTYALKCRIEEKYGKELGLEYQPNSNKDSKYIIYNSTQYGEVGLIYAPLDEDAELLNGEYAYYIKSEKDLSSILNKGQNCGEVTLQDGNKYFFYKYAIEQTDNQTEEQKNNAAMAEQNVIDDFGKLI